ncbi:MAG TPA: helix-turn-helix domain-containing protein [Stellaceae bacterium]|jgi:DNA-binding winged helix-turn-helix (wHTH) protein|nr:helix-turn-helix domain-containing protein [Stellaceae bacterium]
MATSADAVIVPSIAPVFDTDRHLVVVGEDARAVQPRTWQLITFLVARLGRLVTRDALYAEFWPAHYRDAPDPQGLKVQIFYARRILAGSSYRIVTVYDTGWICEPIPERTASPRREVIYDGRPHAQAAA